MRQIITVFFYYFKLFHQTVINTKFFQPFNQNT